MTKTKRLKQLAQQNPKADEKKAKQVVDAIRLLRQQGIRVREYSIKSPFRVRTSMPPFLRVGGKFKVKDYA
jgi:hypothetical protein